MTQKLNLQRDLRTTHAVVLQTDADFLGKPGLRAQHLEEFEFFWLDYFHCPAWVTLEGWGDRRKTTVSPNLFHNLSQGKGNSERLCCENGSCIWCIGRRRGWGRGQINRKRD